MLSKEEAESKLFKIYYTLEMDEIYQCTPESLEINIFEEVSDPNHLEHNWYVGKDKKKIFVQMTAVDYEKGSQYVSGVFAFTAAWKSMKGFIFNQWWLIQLLAIALIIGFEVLETYLLTIRFYFALIPVIFVVLTVFIFFYIQKIRKKSILKAYQGNLKKISDEFDMISSEEHSIHFYKLLTKTFFPSALVSIISVFSLIILIGTTFTS